MDFATFLTLSDEAVAERVRLSGPKVVVFPINGTRRWFLLEHPEQARSSNYLAAYMETAWQRQIELYELFFEHGLDTLVTPIFGPDLLERGEAYYRIIEPGLLWFTQNPSILAFYERYDVRVQVYGDTRRYLAETPLAHALDAFDAVCQKTAAHRRRRLFFGVCAHDPAETVAEFGVNFFNENGRLPDKKEIVRHYYGEYVAPVDFFIGFDRLSAFDMPLISTGSEDLYFTVSPSPYVDAQTLRAILYDHLYNRPVSENYEQLSAEDWRLLAELYRRNRHHVLGVGRRSANGAFWYPLPQVDLPPQLQENTHSEENRV